VREYSFSLSEKEKGDENTKRCRPRKKALSVTSNLDSTKPGPHEAPPAEM